MRTHALLAGAVLAAGLGFTIDPKGAAAVEPTTVRFDPTGAEQTFTVPAGVDAIHLVAVGGAGDRGGAVVTADLPVTPGQTLYVEVGGNGQGHGSAFNGGGPAPDGHGGGGATDLRTCSIADEACILTGDPATDPRLVVAGGAGGAGMGGAVGSGGDGGTPVGQDGFQASNAGPGGRGGSLTAGGAGGVGTHGPTVDCTDGSAGRVGVGGAGGPGRCAFGPFGDAFGGGGGGGGGGWFGGGGGATHLVGPPDARSISGSGGGGGSSHVAASASNVTYAVAEEQTSWVELSWPDPTPVAVDDTYVVNEDVSLALPPPGVLANDTDPAGGRLRARFATQPAHGLAGLGEDGGIVYVPASNYHGTDSFTYFVVNDEELRSAPATVTVTVRPVNDPPALQLLPTGSVRWGDRFAIDARAFDPDAAPGELTYSLVDGPAGASVDPATGWFTWTPTAGQIGRSSITIGVTDGGSPVGSDTVTFDVVVRKRPTALTVPANQAFQFSDPATVSAILTDGGAGVAGRRVTFAIETHEVSATTDAGGRAVVSFVADRPQGNSPVRARFDGDAAYDGSSGAGNVPVRPEDATVTPRTPGLLIAIARPIELRADVAEADDGHLGGFLGATQVHLTLRRVDGAVAGTCTAAVVASGAGRGTARCPVSPASGLGQYRVTAELLGADLYVAPPAQSAPFTLITLL